MTREQLIEATAESMYEGYRADENARRAELRTLMGPSVIRRNGRMTRPAAGPPYDLATWHTLGHHERQVYLARARPVIAALEQRGALAPPGEENVYDVRIDDPDLARPYEYEGLAAFSAWAAAYEGARRVTRTDPLRHLTEITRVPPMLFPGYPPPYSDELVIENPGLIEAIVMYAEVRRSNHDDAEWMKGEALWQGYPPP